MHSVVVVESPSKAKTINKYLGKDYTVLASYGHIRDLPSKNGSVDPDKNFAMIYEIDPDSEKRVKEIAKALKGADQLLLATDPDREGEAISWHVLEALKERKAMTGKIKVGRVVFNEITKKAVTAGVANPRDIDMNLVNAQQARRALDYLVGFTLSPILWRKLPGSRSAGRVQSVALRLICERENEIEAFKEREYWTVLGQMATANNDNFTARLTHYKSDKLEQFSITTQAEAEKIVADIIGKQYQVSAIEEKQARRNPQAPFTTSTLQQEAARKLGFSATKTMTLAQKLYEGIAIGGETVGLITYMRTDGVSVSQEAISAARALIGKKFGENYVPQSQRMYKAKAKNAQEAHEAIRPTDVNRTPEHMGQYLERDMLRLYELVWKRMIASQMESAVLDQVAVDIASSDNQAIFRANGSVIKFDGFYRLYREDLDEQANANSATAEDDENRRLPMMKKSESVACKKVNPEQHFTQAPPRYSEASLVKKLEELGIGRPSTYASIISVLINRGYVILDKKRFMPEEKGRIVSAFLVSFFRKYVEYDFTARLEEELDEVSAGAMEWLKVLAEFWGPFSEKTKEIGALKQSDILPELEKLIAAHVFPETTDDGVDSRKCSKCADGRLGLKLGKFGAFVGCSNYPECNYTKQLMKADGASEGEGGDQGSEFPKEIGNMPDGRPIVLKKGPYGVYMETSNPSSEKPLRAALPKGFAPNNIDIDMAVKLLSLPREVGAHPESGKSISAGIGRYGPYLLHDGKYYKLESTEDALTVGINRAVDIIAAKGAGGRGAESRELGAHTQSGAKIESIKGRYGWYIKHGKDNVRIPKGVNGETLQLAEAIEIIGNAPASGGGGKKSSPKSKGKSSAAKKSPAKGKSAAKSPKKPSTKSPAKKKDL
jgi:DNA topoisomerase-1